MKIFFQTLELTHTYGTVLIVRTYIEGTQNANELSDLLAATPENDIEPTQAALVTGRATLYPDVCFISRNHVEATSLSRAN